MAVNQNVTDLIPYFMNNILGENYDMLQMYLCLMLKSSFIIHMIAWNRCINYRDEIREIVQTTEKLESKI